MFASSPGLGGNTDGHKGQKVQGVIQRGARAVEEKENECLFSLRQADEWAWIWLWEQTWYKCLTQRDKDLGVS